MSRYGPRGAYYPRSGPSGLVIVSILVFLLVVLGIGACATSYYHDSKVTFNLRDKNIIPTGDDGHDYRLNVDVVGGGNETYVIEDSIIKGQLNTGDIYFRLHEGRKYTCDKYGWRHPLLSAFPAVHNCEDVGTADPETEPGR